MRSEIVHRAKRKMPERYQLCKTCSIATRRLHIPSDRIQDTINIVLEMISLRNKTEALSAALASIQDRRHTRKLQNSDESQAGIAVNF